MTTSNATDSRSRAMDPTRCRARGLMKNYCGRASAALRNCAIATALFIMPWIGGCSTVAYTGVGAGASAESAARLPVLPAPKLSLDEIVTLARQGVAADALIARIRAAGAYYRLSAADIISLRERGVPLAVIDNILKSERQFSAAGEDATLSNEPESPPRPRPRRVIGALYHGV